MPRIINLGEQPFSLESGKIDGKLDEMIEALRSQLPGGGSFSLGSINSPTGRYREILLVRVTDKSGMVPVHFVHHLLLSSLPQELLFSL